MIKSLLSVVLCSSLLPAALHAGEKKGSFLTGKDEQTVQKIHRELKDWGQERAVAPADTKTAGKATPKKKACAKVSRLSKEPAFFQYIRSKHGRVVLSADGKTSVWMDEPARPLKDAASSCNLDRNFSLWKKIGNKPKKDFAAGCSGAGGWCEHGGDCCYGWCNNNYCSASGGDDCVSAGGHCGTAADCCTGVCRSGFCTGNGYDDCVSTGGFCYSGADCCEGWCSNNHCKG